MGNVPLLVGGDFSCPSGGIFFVRIFRISMKISQGFVKLRKELGIVLMINVRIVEQTR